MGGTRRALKIRRPNGVWRGCILNLSNSDIWGSFMFCFQNSTDPSELCNGIYLPNVIKVDLTDLSFWRYNLLKIFTVRKSEPDSNDKEKKSLFTYITGLEKAIPTNYKHCNENHHPETSSSPLHDFWGTCALQDLDVVWATRPYRAKTKAGGERRVQHDLHDAQSCSPWT